ncbi:Protein CBG09725 [Caenorhabditis briggsae]|uniref:Protein CBG09725 n=1 Tax=Caenorhabditis briggsae TaxID=6238 RepID=A8X8E8_CAEBR|nr:Protein CBG09725 [Caenorhabditis briggsae]CAP28909.2 Protein CBG09725 [Caenorhabditis briggsae]
MALLIPILLGVLAIIFVMCSKRIKWILKVFEFSDKLPGPTTQPFIGNISSFAKMSKIEMLDYMIKTANELRDSGESIMRFQFIGKLLVFPLDGKSAQTLLQSTTELDKGDDYEFARAWLGRSVLLDGYGERWKSHRRLVTPTFHFAKLEGYLGVFNRETKVMVELLDEFAKSGETVDLFHYIKRCTLDIICGTAMGTTIDAQHNPTHSYVLAVERFNKLSVDHSMKAHLQIPFLFWLLGYQKKKDDYVYTMKKFTRDVTAGRMTDDPNGDVDSEGIKKLDYTERVLKESKRRIAPVPTLQRKLREDMEIAGLRNCVGQKFAQLNEKVLLIHMLRNYRIEPMLDFNGTQPSLEIISRPSNGIPVMLTRR